MTRNELEILSISFLFRSTRSHLCQLHPSRTLYKTYVIRYAFIINNLHNLSSSQLTPFGKMYRMCPPEIFTQRALWQARERAYAALARIFEAIGLPNLTEPSRNPLVINLSVCACKCIRYTSLRWYDPLHIYFLTHSMLLTIIYGISEQSFFTN